MKTLVLKKPDGSIERFTGDEAAARFKTMPVSQIALECMFGGIPLPMPEGEYVVEQEGHEYLIEDFLKAPYGKTETQRPSGSDTEKVS